MSSSNIGEAPAKTFAEYVVVQEKPQRPSLLFRIHSDRLHVQAYAKSLRGRLLSGPLVDITVGEGANQRQWSLHRNLLCYHSEYLKAELQHSANTTPKSKTKGASENLRLDLEKDDPAGFELLVKWLYQGKLDDVSSITDDQEKYNYAVACQKLHNLCDRFEMPKLKNFAIDQYRKGLSEAGLVPDAEELNTIYRQSAKASPFRNLMVKIAARQIMDPDSDKNAESYRQCFENNSEFAIDLVNAIKSGTGGILFDDPTGGTNNCEFHDHANGPNCHQKGKKRQDSKTGVRSGSTSPTTTATTSTPPIARPNGSPPPKPTNDDPFNESIGARPAAPRRGGSTGRAPPSPPRTPSPSGTPTQSHTTGKKRPPPKLRRRNSPESRAAGTV